METILGENYFKFGFYTLEGCVLAISQGEWGLYSSGRYVTDVWGTPWQGAQTEILGWQCSGWQQEDRHI